MVAVARGHGAGGAEDDEFTYGHTADAKSRARTSFRPTYEDIYRIPLEAAYLEFPEIGGTGAGLRTGRAK
ncbi:hypothetical protein GCM10023074_00130 [Microbispora amethystogenes]|uniref:Uncharacterized protein n=1 Tax=Microbispora amethystogenes TaxID=1427754 RepID=A0ABQ4FL71_9ACTN|nr:hypothetical protein Mam01_57270 [Microbispora amethystogenes]